MEEVEASEIKVRYVKRGVLGADVAGKLRTYPMLSRFIKPVILIDERFKNNTSLLLHELVHYEQFCNNGFHSLRYFFSLKYRRLCEARAYGLQIVNNFNDEHFKSMINYRFLFAKNLRWDVTSPDSTIYLSGRVKAITNQYEEKIYSMLERVRICE